MAIGKILQHNKCLTAMLLKTEVQIKIVKMEAQMHL